MRWIDRIADGGVSWRTGCHFKNMFGGGAVPPPAALPAPVPPPTMPDPNGPASREAARKTAADAAGRAGRSASVLTTAMGRNTIAGGGAAAPYSGAKLGG